MFGCIRLCVDANLALVLGCDERAGLDHRQELARTVVVLRWLELGRSGIDVVLNGEVRVGTEVLTSLLFAAYAQVDRPLLVKTEGRPQTPARLLATAELPLRGKERPDVAEGVSS